MKRSWAFLNSVSSWAKPRGKQERTLMLLAFCRSKPSSYLITMNHRSFFSLLGLAAAPALALSVHAADAVDFTKDVKPVLELNCVKCHGPEQQKGKLRMDSLQ